MAIYKDAGSRKLPLGTRSRCSRRLATNPAKDILGKCHRAINRGFPIDVCASFWTVRAARARLRTSRLLQTAAEWAPL